MARESVYREKTNSYPRPSNTCHSLSHTGGVVEQATSVAGGNVGKTTTDRHIIMTELKADREIEIDHHIYLPRFFALIKGFNCKCEIRTPR